LRSIRTVQTLALKIGGSAGHDYGLATTNPGISDGRLDLRLTAPSDDDRPGSAEPGPPDDGGTLASEHVVHDIQTVAYRRHEHFHRWCSLNCSITWIGEATATR